MSKIQLFNKNFFAMNTRFEVIFWNDTHEKFEILLNSIQKSVQQLENLISCYDKLSEVYHINHSKASEQIKISDTLWEIIILMHSYKTETLSCFDYCLPKSLDSGIKFGESVELDKSEKTLKFIKEGYEIDFGAVGKGLALENVKVILKKNKIKNCFLSFGDSSILTLGSHPHGSYWPFSLKDIPKEINFKLNDHCVSTSATIQPNGKNHIVDPRTGEIIKKRKMISVKSKSAVESEILSTALLVANEQEQTEILHKFKNFEIIEVKYNLLSKPEIRRILC